MKADGAALLALSEELGLAPLAAAWLYDHDIGEWRYHLVSPLVGIVGRKEVYDGLAKAIAKTDLAPRVSIVDVYLAGTNDLPFQVMASCRSGGAKGGVTVQSCSFNGTRIDAYIYRWADQSLTRNEADLKRGFRRALRSYLQAPAASSLV